MKVSTIILFLIFILSIPYINNALCLTSESNINNSRIFKPKKHKEPKFTYLEEVYFKHSKRKQPLYGVNSIWNDGNYLLLGTDKGLVRFSKRNFKAERLTSKKYRIESIVKNNGIYWMVIYDYKNESSRLVKYNNSKFINLLRQDKDYRNIDIKYSGKNKGVWIIIENNSTKKDGTNELNTKLTVKNTILGLKKNPFIINAEIYDTKTDNKGNLWIASSEGIFSLNIDKRNNLKTKKFEYIARKLQIINNQIHFINGDTLYNIKNGKVNFQEYRKDINNSIYANNSFLKHIENIGNDENVCKSGIIEIKNNSVSVFGEDGIISDTNKIFTKLRNIYWTDYMKNVNSYFLLPNGNFIYIVIGHGHVNACYNGIYIFDGKKAYQTQNIGTHSCDMILDKNKVWISDGSDWFMSKEGIGGGLCIYEF